MSHGDSKRELRDRFAMHALTCLSALIAAGIHQLASFTETSASTNEAKLAFDAYRLADAMLAERETVKPVPTMEFYKDVRGVLEKMLKDEKQFSARSEFNALDNYRCVTNLVIAMLNEAIRRENRQ